MLHHEIFDTILRTDVVESTNVGVAKTGDDLRFALEALTALSVMCEVLQQHLYGDGAAQPYIEGPIDLTHTSGGYKGLHFVGTENAAGKLAGHMRGVQLAKGL